MERTPSGHTAEEVRTVALGDGWYQRGDVVTKMEHNVLAVVDLAQFRVTDKDTRLKNCGLVWHEDQLTSRRWVAPPTRIPDEQPGRIKVMPLFMVSPVPGMEITALDGEKYLLPKDFKGNWFNVVSPKGVKLIA